MYRPYRCDGEGTGQDKCNGLSCSGKDGGFGDPPRSDSPTHSSGWGSTWTPGLCLQSEVRSPETGGTWGPLTGRAPRSDVTSHNNNLQKCLRLRSRGFSNFCREGLLPWGSVSENKRRRGRGPDPFINCGVPERLDFRTTPDGRQLWG